MTATVTITTRATAITSITLIYGATINTMTNSDPYAIDVNHNDDKYEKYVDTGFRRKNSAYSPERRHIRRPIWLRCTRLSAALIRLLTYRLSRRLEGTQPFMLLLDW